MSNYRKQDKEGNLFSAIEHQQAVAKREIGILRLFKERIKENGRDGSHRHFGGENGKWSLANST